MKTKKKKEENENDKDEKKNQIIERKRQAIDEFEDFNENVDKENKNNKLKKKRKTIPSSKKIIWSIFNESLRFSLSGRIKKSNYHLPIGETIAPYDPDWDDPLKKNMCRCFDYKDPKYSQNHFQARMLENIHPPRFMLPDSDFEKIYNLKNYTQNTSTYPQKYNLQQSQRLQQFQQPQQQQQQQQQQKTQQFQKQQQQQQQQQPQQQFQQPRYQPQYPKQQYLQPQPYYQQPRYPQQ